MMLDNSILSIRFIAVAIVSVAFFLYRITSLWSIRFRLQGLEIQSVGGAHRTKGILQVMALSDWVLLRLLRLNLDEITFDKLMYSIEEQLI
jgi:hypothetical protein